MAQKRHKPSELAETDFARERMGRNSLQGDDQSNVRNQRHAQADAKKTTDGPIESARKLDKDYRAEKDLGKGRRKGDGEK
jgi:hypothetical protein